MNLWLSEMKLARPFQTPHIAFAYGISYRKSLKNLMVNRVEIHEFDHNDKGIARILKEMNGWPHYSRIVSVLCWNVLYCSTR
jgi:hypothetical protein